MSAAKMVADSTQGDSNTDNTKKRKKKIKKSANTKNKVLLPEDEDSDLDLKKDLHPIGFYMKDRSAMIEEMFHSVRGASLQRALPELLKSMPLEELKDLCLEQLEVMSKKRIQRILAGEESANISSSGTDDMDYEEEDVDSSDGGGGEQTDAVSDNVVAADTQKTEVGLEKERAELTADSTSAVVPDQSQNSLTPKDGVVNNGVDNNTDKMEQQQIQEPPLPPVDQVVIKQEPPDSDHEPTGGGGPRNYRRGNRSSGSSDRSRDSSSRSRSRSRSGSSRSSSGSSYRRRRRRRRRRSRRRRGRSDSRSSSSSSSRSRSRSRTSSESEKASLIEGGYEDPPEAYTSGSEDGELVRKEVVVKPVTIKQEVMSEPEDGEVIAGTAGGSGVVNEAHDSLEIGEKSMEGVSVSNGGGGGDGAEQGSIIPSLKDIESDLLASVTERNLGGDESREDEEDSGDDDGKDNKTLDETKEDDDDGDGDSSNNKGVDDSKVDGSAEEGMDDSTATDAGGGGGGGSGGGDDTGEGVSGGTDGEDNDSVLPAIMTDQMELLELEMRARAIKAMLMTSSSSATSQPDDGSGAQKE